MVIKETDYVVIPGCFVSVLRLKGNTLLVLSIINGFSQGLENQLFEGSNEYLADWCGCNEQEIEEILNYLEGENHIIRESFIWRNERHTGYAVNYINNEGGSEL